jgi:hypothetical protein
MIAAEKKYFPPKARSDAKKVHAAEHGFDSGIGKALP